MRRADTGAKVTPAPARRRVGLRMRMTLAFALGALALSVMLATLTYELSRTYLLRQREQSVLRQAYVNAGLVRGTLGTSSPPIARLLASLELPSGSHPVLSYQGKWCFVFGRRSNGYFDLRTLDGTRVSACASYKKLTVVQKASAFLVERRAASPPVA